jgi:phosphoglycerol transferase
MMEARMLARTHPFKRLCEVLQTPGRWEPAFFGLAVLALMLFTGYFQVNLAEPGSLTSDHVFTLVGAKSVIAQAHHLPPKLGFPELRDEHYFPNFDSAYRPMFLIAGRLTNSPFVLIHILYLFGLTAMACAYYWSLRRLQISAWLAIVGSLAAAVTPFLEERTYFHDALALSFSVPLGFGLALQLGRDAPTASLKSFFKDPLILLSLLIVGTSGLYYAFYSALIAVFVGAAVSLGERRLFPIAAALLMAEAILVLLLLSGYGLDWSPILPAKGGGAPHQVERVAFEQLGYGLNLAGAADRFAFVPKVAEEIADTARLTPIFVGDRGAWPALPLTLIILASPLICAAGQARLRTLQGPAAPKLRLALLSAATLTFLVLFGARGGLGYIFNLLASPAIRADSRVLPFLAFGAVVILCLFAEMARDSERRWMRWAGPAAIALILLAGAAGSFGLAARLQNATLANPGVKAVRTSLKGMLAAKDRAGLETVLQLPVLPWPEVLWLKPGYSPYEMQLPYVFDRLESPTRWSYGADEQQAGFKRLDAQTKSLDGLVERARRMGFDSIEIEKRAYDPGPLAAVEAAVDAQAGAACRLFDDPTYTLYALKCTAGASRP